MCLNIFYLFFKTYGKQNYYNLSKLKTFLAKNHLSISLIHSTFETMKHQFETMKHQFETMKPQFKAKKPHP